MAKARILVAGREAASAEQIRDSLSKLSYQAMACTLSSSDLIQHVVEQDPNLVILDVDQVSGEAISAGVQLRKHFDIPILYVSSAFDETTLRRVKISIPSGYLLKPLDLDQLHAAIEIARHKYLIERQQKDNIAEPDVGKFLRRRNLELTLLNRAGQVIISRLDLDAVLTTILEEVRQLLNIVAASI